MMNKKGGRYLCPFCRVGKMTEFFRLDVYVKRKKTSFFATAAKQTSVNFRVGCHFLIIITDNYLVNLPGLKIQLFWKKVGCCWLYFLLSDLSQFSTLTTWNYSL